MTIRCLLACLTLAVAGCVSDLQRPYVEAVEAIRVAVEADVLAGVYQVDTASRTTLDHWRDVQREALESLEVDGK